MRWKLNDVGYGRGPGQAKTAQQRQCTYGIEKTFKPVLLKRPSGGETVAFGDIPLAGGQCLANFFAIQLLALNAVVFGIGESEN